MIRNSKIFSALGLDCSDPIFLREFLNNQIKRHRLYHLYPLPTFHPIPGHFATTTRPLNWQFQVHFKRLTELPELDHAIAEPGRTPALNGWCTSIVIYASSLAVYSKSH
jgi:hypothetical protein